MKRNYSLEFKTEIARKLQSGVSIDRLSKKYKLHPVLISRWRKQLKEGKLVFHKPGRHTADLFDALRLRLVFQFIHDEIDISINELAHRMRIVMHKFFKDKVTQAGLRAWLYQLSNGSKASIKPSNLWALLYSIHEDFYWNIEQPLRLIDGLDNNVDHILAVMHYAVNANFFRLDMARKKLKKDVTYKAKEEIFIIDKELLKRLGPDIYFYEDGKYKVPNIAYLSAPDMTVDIREILQRERGIDISPEDAESLVTAVERCLNEGITYTTCRRGLIEISKALKKGGELFGHRIDSKGFMKFSETAAMDDMRLCIKIMRMFIAHEWSTILDPGLCMALTHINLEDLDIEELKKLAPPDPNPTPKEIKKIGDELLKNYLQREKCNAARHPKNGHIK